MDDPWGSPWTTADADKDAKPPSPAKSTRSDLEPPPRAFFSLSGSPRIPAITGPSPWADEEDGFGDWAAPEIPAQNQTQSGWGGGWVAPSPNLTSPPRDDVFGHASPIAWPGSIALPKPANSGLVRQPSPDPWSTEFSPSLDGASTPRLIVDTPPLTDASLTKQRPSELGSPIWEKTEPDYNGNAWEEGIGREGRVDGDVLMHDEAAADLPGVDEKATAEEKPNRPEHDDALRLSVESADQSRESPSPSGDDTDVDDDRQDSPITSVDEDAKSRQALTRKTSGKVQQLVVKFDGLARAASQEPPAVRRERSKSPLDARRRDDGAHDEDAEHGADFGEFEDVQDDAPDVPDRGRPRTPDEQPISKAIEETPKSVASVLVTSPQATRDPTSTDHLVVTKRPNVQFDVNPREAEKLFEADKLDSVRVVGADADVSDYILTDSFTEISERKTWYRISRMGSSRKYNTGDDENYRLVTWPTSTIHDDTIKIVRRWMEEDSIAGRVALGGGVSKTQKNMFGWDSSAETIPLDAVFGRKKSHARASSLQSSGKGMAGGQPRPSSVMVPPVAAFGWSTKSPTWSQPTQSPSFIPPPERTPTTPLVPAPPQPQPQPQPQPSVTKIIAPVSVVPHVLAPPAQDDDEDEWGEMVASPSGERSTEDAFQNLDAAFSAPLRLPLPGPTAVPTAGITQPPVAEPQLSSFTAVTAPAPLPPSATAVDPWATVDFSVFESAAKPAADPPKPQTTVAFMTPAEPTPSQPSSTVPFASSSKPSASMFEPATPVATKQLIMADPSFTPTTPLEISSPQPLPSSEDDYFAVGKSQSVDDAAIRQILDNLPDLSFMLR